MSSQVIALKRLFEVVNGSTPKSDNPDYWDGDIPWVSPVDLSNDSDKFISSTSRKITKSGLDSCGTSIVPAGSIILSCRAPIGSIGISLVEMCTNQGCKSLVKKSKNISEKFYYYVLSAANSELNSLGKGTTFLELSTDTLSDYKVPNCSLDRQQKIANFLDRETAKIDELIQKQEKLIELIEEERKAIINQNVCRGLNSKIELKKTGISWLENIPAHWHLKPLKYLISFNDEVLPESTHDDFELKYVEIGDVSERSGITNSTEVEFKDAASRARRLVKNGDILISTVRTYLRAIAPVINPPSNMVVSTGFAVIRPRNLNSDYARFLLSTEYFLNEVIARSTGVSYPAINASDLVQIKVPVPPIEEQKKIAEFIKHKCAAIELLVNRSESSIKLLKEHRTSLISAAVTGKIDVRELV